MSKYTRTVLLLFAVLFVGCNGAGNALDDPVRHEGRYQVVYHANESSSGSAPVDSALYFTGEFFSVSLNTGELSKDGYSFMGWNTKADGSGETYPSGGSFEMGISDVNLYAKWSCGTPIAAFTPSFVSNKSEFRDICVDKKRNVYVVGNIFGNGVFDFDNEVRVSGCYSGGGNILLLKKDFQGRSVWARSISGYTNITDAKSVICDSEGNVYIAGNIYGVGSVDFGNDVQCSTNSSGNNIFLAKYNSSGSALWAKTSLSGAGYVTQIILDSEDSILALGKIEQGPIVFDKAYSSSGVNDISFITKYDKNGVVLQVNTVEGVGGILSKIEIDNAGNYYCFGYFSNTNTINFGDGVSVVGKVNGEHLLLVKYDKTGFPLWAISDISDANVNIYSSSMSIDQAGNLYLCGFLQNGSGKFGSWVTVSPEYLSSTMFLVKYSAKGIAQWGRTIINSDNSSYATSIHVDKSGNVLVAGFVHGISDFDLGDGVVFSSVHDGYTPILLCYGASGSIQWYKNVTTSDTDGFFYGLSESTDGDIYACGRLGSGVTNFGNGVTAAGVYNGNNALLVKYQ